MTVHTSAAINENPYVTSGNVDAFTNGKGPWVADTTSNLPEVTFVQVSRSIAMFPVIGMAVGKFDAF